MNLKVINLASWIIVIGGKKEAFYTSLLALGNGISMIEKHFTLDRKKLKITSQDFQKINLNIL